MAKARAGRRDQRQAKRAVAKELRGTKYANQKGGIEKPKRRKASSMSAVEDDESPMAVIRHGKPVWTGSDGPSQSDNQTTDDNVGAHETQDERFTSAQKKLRALNKKLRHVLLIKEQRRQGFELNGTQQASVRGEAALRQEIDRFEKEAVKAAGRMEDDTVNKDAGPSAAVDDAADSDTQADLVGASSVGGSRLEQRRALKKQRHLEKLRLKRPLEAAA